MAVQEGKAPAANICRLLSGRRLKRFRPRHSGYIIPLTGRYAVAALDLPWKPIITGRLAFIMFQFVLLRYFLTILPTRKALRHWRNYRADVGNIHAAGELYER